MIAAEIALFSILGTLLFSTITKFSYEKFRNKLIRRKFIFKRIYKNRSHTEDCVICYENLKYKRGDSGTKCVQLYCNHQFHRQCLKEWFKQRITCPLCNQSLKTCNGDKLENYLMF